VQRAFIGMMQLWYERNFMRKLSWPSFSRIE
jgi:hypothetical protein